MVHGVPNSRTWLSDFTFTFTCHHFKHAKRLTCLLRNLYAGQEATVRTGHGTIDWFQIGKEYVKAVYCHPPYLIYMQSTSWETLGWMMHKPESRLPGEISITSEKQMTLPFGRNWRVTKEPLDESERREWKSWLKTQHSKTKIVASGPITSWQIDGETMETLRDLYFLGLQNYCRWWVHPWN